MSSAGVRGGARGLHLDLGVAYFLLCDVRFNAVHERHDSPWSNRQNRTNELPGADSFQHQPPHMRRQTRQNLIILGIIGGALLLAYKAGMLDFLMPEPPARAGPHFTV